MHSLFRGVAVIPVLTIEREEDAVPLARALLDGGLRLVEVTLRTPAALPAIAAIAREVPQVVVGAGTVQRPADIVQACTAGARFLVSPGMTPELAAAALATELPYLPGVATPSEVMTARDLGVSFLKLFPAEAVGGLALLQVLAPVFRGSHSARPAASTSAPRPSTWRCPMCRWSAGHGWRPGRLWPPVTGRQCAALPNVRPLSEGSVSPNSSAQSHSGDSVHRAPSRLPGESRDPFQLWAPAIAGVAEFWRQTFC